MRLLVLLFFVLCFGTLKAQSYSYGFQGPANANQISELEKKCSVLPDVNSCKVRYKDPEEKGELIIELKYTGENRAETRDGFNPAEVKRLLLEMGLNPLELRQINKQ